MDIYLLTVLEAGSSRAGRQNGQVLVRSRLLSRCVLIYLSSASHKATFLSDEGPIFMTSLNLNYHLEALSPNASVVRGTVRSIA